MQGRIKLIVFLLFFMLYNHVSAQRTVEEIRDCGQPLYDTLKTRWDSLEYKLLVKYRPYVDSTVRALFGDAFFNKHIRVNLSESYANAGCQNGLDSCYSFYPRKKIVEPAWYQYDLCLDSCYCGEITYATFHYNFLNMLRIRFSNGVRFYSKNQYKGALITKRTVDSLAWKHLKLKPGEFVFDPFITNDEGDWLKSGKLRIKLHASDVYWETEKNDFIDEGKYVIVDPYTGVVLEQGDPKRRLDIGYGYEESSVRRGKRENCYEEEDTVKCFLLNKYRYKADSLMVSLFGQAFYNNYISLNMHSSRVQNCYDNNIDSCDYRYGKIKTYKWPITYVYDLCFGDTYCGYMLEVQLDYENNLSPKIWKGPNFYVKEKHVGQSLLSQEAIDKLARKHLNLGSDGFYIRAEFTFEQDRYYDGIAEKSGRLLLQISAPNKEWYDGGYRHFVSGKYILVDAFTGELIEKKGTRKEKWRPDYY